MIKQMLLENRMGLTNGFLEEVSKEANRLMNDLDCKIISIAYPTNYHAIIVYIEY